MKKNIPILLIFTNLLLASTLQASINPLSKIIITSNRATCQKDHDNPQQYIFNYQENVLVTFADASTITANDLKVVFEGKDLGKTLSPKPIEAGATPNTKKNFLDKFKKIIFSGNVIFTSQSRTAVAQKAELQLAEHLCTLTGNVVITQKKTAPKEIPVTIESNEAKINLQTQELLLSGSENKPVNTVISLEDYEPLKKMKRSKHKKKK